MPIVELFLGALITVLFERLASKEVLNFARREGIESQLKKWSKMLVKIEAVLADAEHKQIHATGEHNQLNLWLQDLRDLAYDVDDLLDGFAYDALAKSNTSSARGESSKVHRLGRCFGACNPCLLVSGVKMEQKIKVITARFQDIVNQQDLLHLSETPTASVGRVGNTDDWSPSCVVDETAIFGRENDKEAIIQMLLQGRDQVGVGVLPIIGMGGVGKTTLAQLIYNDNTIQDLFPVRAWTCVSDQFDIVRITRSILESLKVIPSGTDLSSLQVELKESLSGKKFLIILDDVWNENYHAWDSLKVPFSSGMSGSMIIVTTRNNDVASLVGNMSPYSLTQLSDDVCLSIFLFHAIGVPSFDAHKNLADIGIQIAERCKGLPLAAKMLGGILRNKERREQWKDILESDIWELPESGILPALKLSYYHLPPHLKQCFAYCSLFPKDYEFDKRHLVLLWMAEGFLQPRSNQNQKKQAEDLGSDYFDVLTSRSFFQPSSTRSSTFVMHNLIHNLARHVASDAFLHVDNHDATSQDANIRVRHSSFVRRRRDTFKRLKAFGDMGTVRTFLALSVGMHGDQSYLSSKVLPYLLRKFTRLRVMSLSGYKIEELPNSVGQLKHLRYLNLADAEIVKLPESVTSLFNLLSLILRRCKKLRELPSSIGDLVNLRCLDLDDTPKLLRIPNGIKYMTGLQNLTKFIVGKDEELGISDLKKFISLRGKLSVEGLHNVVDISSAIHAGLNGKDALEELHMEWRNEFDDPRDEEIEGQVLDCLQPPKSLHVLEILYYGGKQLPFWIGDPLCAPNMVRLRIDGCKNVTSLPPLGRLPLLKELTLCGMDGVTSVGEELYGHDDPLFVGKTAFPSLETLSIRDMLGWEEWSCSNGLYLLHTLVLKNCPKLMGKLPSHLPSLKEVLIKDCPQLSTAPITTWSPASLSDLCLAKCVIDEGFLQVHVSSLTKLSIAYIPDLRSLNMLNSFQHLHELRIEKCPRLVSFGEISLPSTLKSLRMISCEALETLPLMHVECFLEDLFIWGCKSLEYFPVVKEAKSNKLVCWRVKSLSILYNDRLPQDIMVHGIESLRIENCSSLTSFPARGKRLPSSLKSLFISDWKYLRTLTEGMLMQDNDMPLPLEAIHISNCSFLASFPTVGKLPTSLKILRIRNCSRLAAIPETLPGSSLEEIDISRCYNLQEFPESLVQSNTLSLKKVTVADCKKLRSLPIQMNSLTRLVELEIDDCPAIRWSNIPQGGGLGWPLNVEKLEIGKTPLHEKDMSKWGLDCLTSLRSLSINGEGMDDVVSFPECFFLPTSLTNLEIYGFKNLKSLSNGLQELSSLQDLSIIDCPQLRYLPPEGLPSTLEDLFICKSLVMSERCIKGGHYWPIISRIPFVRTDDSVQ